MKNESLRNDLLQLCLDNSQDESVIEKKITDAFHLMYYSSSHTWNNGNTKWMGVACFQNPLDIWIFQETIFEKKPSLIIECGSFMGGTSLFLAQMMDLSGVMKEGCVIAIDVGDESKVEHERIRKLTGRSTSSLVLNRIQGIIESNQKIMDDDKIMVILDSDHSTENVLNELRIYSKIVSHNQYLVVMDSNLGGNPIHVPSIGPGPMQAIEMFMRDNDEFEIDREKEKFYFTFCPNGWLRRK
jgi:cephalosporin hydroxylase